MASDTQGSDMPTTGTPASAPAEVDARATRFTASVTAAVLAAVLLLSSISLPVAMTLLAVQAIVFGVGAIWGPARHPYGAAFHALIAPRLGPPTTREAVEQLRFAQLLGCIFCSTGVIGFALDIPVVGVTATGVALFAALIRAVFGICLSRRPYMLVSKMRGNVPACCQNK